jgi:hypothetical protein
MDTTVSVRPTAIPTPARRTVSVPPAVALAAASRAILLLHPIPAISPAAGRPP